MAAPGVGYTKPNRRGEKRIVIGFPNDDFETIRTLAEKAGTSFAEQVRTLVEWGMEALNDKQ